MESSSPPKQFEYTYSVSDEQIQEYRQRSLTQIFEWLSSTLDFISCMQSPEERENWNKIRNGEMES